MTIAYGNGIIVSPLHLASAYATMVNGGYQVEPSFHVRKQNQRSIISEETSSYLRLMLRQVVQEGMGVFADAKGFEVGGTGGTAYMSLPQGYYSEEATVATFAAVFPMSNPEYVVVTMLENPEYEARGETRRSSAWTAAPLAGDIIYQVGPMLLGLNEP